MNAAERIWERREYSVSAKSRTTPRHPKDILFWIGGSIAKNGGSLSALGSHADRHVLPKPELAVAMQSHAGSFVDDRDWQ